MKNKRARRDLTPGVTITISTVSHDIIRTMILKQADINIEYNIPKIDLNAVMRPIDCFENPEIRFNGKAINILYSEESIRRRAKKK